MIKKFAVNTFFTTGVAAILLCFFGTFTGETLIVIRVFYEILGANFLINLGMYFIKKIECQSFFLDCLLDIGYIMAVLIVFGIIFNWFGTISVWYLFAMALVIYIFAIAASLHKIRRDTKELNDLLEKLKEKNR